MSDPERDDPETNPAGPKSGWGSRLQDLKISDALGGWVRRVGEIVEELSDQERLSPEAKEQWAPLASAWEDEDFTALLQDLPEGPGADRPALPAGMIEALVFLAATHARLIDDPEAPALGQRAHALREAEAESDGARAARRLYEASRHLDADAPAKARDELRRARAELRRIPKSLRLPFGRLSALLAAEAWSAEGQVDKAARAIDEARALTDEGNASLRRRLDLVAIHLWLALDRLDEADALSAEFSTAAPDDLEVTATRARVLASRGQLDAARALREPLRGALEEKLPQSAARLALTLDPPELAAEAAARWLRGAPADPMRLRLWALARLGPELDCELSDADLDAALDALEAGVRGSAERARAQRARELAFVLLRRGVDPSKRPLDDAGDLEAPLARALAAASAGRAPALTMDEEGRPELPFAPLGAPGPDELSPLRKVDLHARTLSSRCALIAGLEARRRGDPIAAHAHFVDALVEEPGFDAAQSALAAERPYPSDGRLESLLSALTDRFGALPQQVLGLEVEGLSAALEATIAARERLARPLTIAIMGEFSAGKSTFVNAWLGRALAPMGALPTTSTINVFRRGGRGNARIHRRDGRVEHVQHDQVHAYLDGLDESAAAEIRHVEIERGDAGFGDATVVDTPGLNALDPYHERVAREFLAEADAIVWIFSATRGAAESERAMLEELRGDGRKVLGILNKADVLEGGEVEELMAYLRDRLGEVLVDVVPLCASAALEARVQPKGEATDALNSLETVQASLERHFLAQARALKSEVLRRRLLDAIEAARLGVLTVVERLERKADLGEVPDAQALRARIQVLGDAITRDFDAVADLLMRELLSMGVAEVGEGRVAGRPSGRDLDYLAQRLARELGDRVRGTLHASEGPRDARLAELLGAHATPWIGGMTSALHQFGGLRALVERAADAASEGEAAMRRQLRVELDTIGESLTEELRALDRRAAALYAGDARRRGGRPKAEAVRLRVLALGELDRAQRALEGAAPAEGASAT